MTALARYVSHSEHMFEIVQDSLTHHKSLEERAKKAIDMGVVQQTWLN